MSINTNINYEKLKSNIHGQMKALEKKHNYDEALELANDPIFDNDPEIQSEIMYILLQKGEYNKAYDIFLKMKDVKKTIIQNKGIGVLIRLKKYKEAKELIDENDRYIANNLECDLSSVNYVMSKLKFYMEVNDYENASKICDNPKYKNEKYVISAKKKLPSLYGQIPLYLVQDKINKKEEPKIINLEDDQIASILVRIDSNLITLDEINECQMNYFDKKVLVLAYYDKNNPFKGKEYIREIKRLDQERIEKKKKETKFEKFTNRAKLLIGLTTEIDNTLTTERLKILNKISERLSIKKNRKFDLYFYLEILNRKGITLEQTVEYIDKLRKEKEKNKVEIKEENKRVKPIIEDIPVKKITNLKVNNKMIGVTGVNINNRYNSNGSNIINNISVDNSSDINKKDVIYIKDEYSYEIEELKKYLYCMMQPGFMKKEEIKELTDYYNFAIRRKMPIPKTPIGMVAKAYDNLEALIDNPITKKDKLEKFLSILLKASTKKTITIYNEKEGKYESGLSESILNINTDRILKEYNKVKTK